MIELTYETLLQSIEDEKPLTFARYGDGEWNAIFGKKKNGNIASNCDGHPYYEDMGEYLRKALASKPEYHLGIQGLAMRKRGDQIKEFCEEHGLDTWFDADILHRASIKGKINNFLWKLEQTDNIVLVAPEYAESLIELFEFNYHIEIPEKNCWLNYKQTCYELSKVLNRMRGKGGKKYTIVIFIASMMANVMIHEFYKNYGDYVSLFDCGSVFDPYIGKKTRSYHEKIMKK